MRNAAQRKPVRPSKRDIIVIDDDESTNEQPAAKTEKPDPSSEVVKLQEEVKKWTDKFQRACREARKEQLRAEAAESRLDSKFGIKDGLHAEKEHSSDLEKRLAEVSSQLEESRRTADNAVNAILDLTHENDSLKMALAEMTRAHQEKLAEVSSQLDESRRATDNAANAILDLAHENEALKTELAETKSAQQERIDHLTRGLAMYEEKLLHESQQLPQALPPPPPPAQLQLRLPLLPTPPLLPKSQITGRAAAVVVKGPNVGKQPKSAAKIDYPANIFHLCSPNSIEATSYESARADIVSVINLYPGAPMENKLKHSFWKFPVDLVLKCEVCETTELPAKQILTHFLSRGHAKQVRGRGAVVSKTALRFWLDKLQPASAATPRPMQQPNATTYRLL